MLVSDDHINLANQPRDYLSNYNSSVFFEHRQIVKNILVECNYQVLWQVVMGVHCIDERI